MTSRPAPQAPLFHASAVKVNRARHHWAALELLAREHVESNPVRHEVSHGPGKIGFKSHFRGAPEEFGAVVGDIMHNLRAALDLLACDLVRAKDGNVKGVYFPFCDAKKDINEMIRRRNFQRAGAEAVALLKSMEPYHGGNAALRAIHDLDIQDKHLELIPTAMSWVSPVIRVEKGDGGKILDFSVVESSIDKTEVKLLFPAGSALEGKEIVPTIHELIELTAGIVEAFKALSEVPGVGGDVAGAHEPPPVRPEAGAAEP